MPLYTLWPRAAALRQGLLTSRIAPSSSVCTPPGPSRRSPQVPSNAVWSERRRTYLCGGRRALRTLRRSLPGLGVAPRRLEGLHPDAARLRPDASRANPYALPGGSPPRAPDAPLVTTLG